MLGDSLASVCESQSVFAPASPGAPRLVGEGDALAARKGCRCRDTRVARAGKRHGPGGQPRGTAVAAASVPLGTACGGLFAATSEMHPFSFSEPERLGRPQCWWGDADGADRHIKALCQARHG